MLSVDLWQLETVTVRGVKVKDKRPIGFLPLILTALLLNTDLLDTGTLQVGTKTILLMLAGRGTPGHRR